ncbi:LysR substrate-binding domain-containing protein [Terrarubrum flagellatum]|uniref:LysR substrate-binding domain-containing protein n=1 Tax=Terrirubrum flagellatum TaxID=2895980 RepID=UPI003145438C
MSHISALPPLDALQAVLAAARFGSFSAAAHSLDITHGAISRRISAVEQWADVTLFVRHGRGVRLTLEGQRLASRIELAVALIEDGRISGQKETQLDVVRVGIVQSFARLWLIPHLAALEGTPQDLRIELEIDHQHMTLSDARIAIRLGRGGWPGVTSEPLFRETLFPVAHDSIAAELGPEPSAAQILTYPLIHDASVDGWRLWLSGNGETYERRATDRLLQGYDLALLAAAHGLGIALARDPYGRNFAENNGLVPLPGLRIENPLSFHVVTRPGPRHQAVQRLLERIRHVARN